MKKSEGAERKPMRCARALSSSPRRVRPVAWAAPAGDFLDVARDDAVYLGEKLSVEGIVGFASFAIFAGHLDPARLDEAEAVEDGVDSRPAQGLRMVDPAEAIDGGPPVVEEDMGHGRLVIGFPVHLEDGEASAGAQDSEGLAEDGRRRREVVEGVGDGHEVEASRLEGEGRGVGLHDARAAGLAEVFCGRCYGLGLAIHGDQFPIAAELGREAEGEGP